ncbi:MAG: adenosylmethionine--8-amino-7-oxononanoate transaminase [Hydrogenophilus sp.]|nr:adenosylmethionine--8-amino-7-oxononanoate transaminase [Hydrogenophilus sp.]
MMFQPSPALAQRSLAAVWHPCTQMYRHLHPDPERRVPLLEVARAEGVWLFDPSGRRYYDAISSWWTTLFGHRHPPILAAIIDQLSRLDHVLLAGCTHEPAVALAEALSEATGKTLGHAFYASDGASAVEIALKMAAHYWRNQGAPHKHRFIAFAGGYHGETIGALSVTDLHLFRDPYAPLLQPVSILPSPADDPTRALAELEHLLTQIAEQIAAVIIEPLVQCAGGMRMYPPSFLRELRLLCDRYRLLLIFDEIAVAFGRTGWRFAHEAAGVRPDLLTLSKGITGGTLPLAVLLATDAIYQAFLADDLSVAFLHSHSYTGNPLACRAALATLSCLDDPTLWSHLEALGAALQQALQPIAARYDAPIRRTGTIVAFDLPQAPADFPARTWRVALTQGLLLRPIGRTLYLMPPFTTPLSLIDWIAEAIDRTLTAVLAPPAGTARSASSSSLLTPPPHP